MNTRTTTTWLGNQPVLVKESAHAAHRGVVKPLKWEVRYYCDEWCPTKSSHLVATKKEALQIKRDLRKNRPHSHAEVVKVANPGESPFAEFLRYNGVFG